VPDPSLDAHHRPGRRLTDVSIEERAIARSSTAHAAGLGLNPGISPAFAAVPAPVRICQTRLARARPGISTLVYRWRGYDNLLGTRASREGAPDMERDAA
jgi:hypothetical protein